MTDPKKTPVLIGTTKRVMCMRIQKGCGMLSLSRTNDDVATPLLQRILVQVPL